MKMKLTTLLFGLLLAVGWTSNVFAQSATYKAEDIKDWTYTWEDAGGNTQTSKYIDEVTDPYQMYGLLRWIYMDKRFPGPTYSAYKADGTTRERKVYYGGMDGGWEIPGVAIPTPPVTTTTITEYVKVTSTADLTSGAEYLIVYETDNVAFNGALSTLDVGNNIINVSRNGNIIESTATTDAATFTITANGSYYTIRSKSGKYIGRTSSSNGFNENATTVYNNSITFNNNNVVIRGRSGTSWTAYDTYYLRFNSASGTNNYRFRYYAQTSQQNIQLYKKQTTTITTGGNQGIPAITIYGNGQEAMKSITVKSGNTTLFSWSMANNGLNHVPGMNQDTWNYYGNTSIIAKQDNPITLQGWLFEGYSNVSVIINAYYNTNYSSATITVNGETKTITGGGSNYSADYTWNISSRTLDMPVKYEDDTYTPNEEGYTALVVKLKNKIVPDSINETYDTKEQIINYLRTNVKSIQLLTDGLRIGEGENVGTVFNCPSTDVYNRFFFLGKGQARQKSDIVIIEQDHQEKLLGEEVPFRQLFEQFSPTGGKKGDDIKDFYSKMMKGEVFPVVHDCLSVIENEHEFSMSGHGGETSYDMPGMNFFIPDYRLKYWELTDTVTVRVWNSSTSTHDRVKTTYIVDGRDMNPYQPGSATKTNEHSTFFTTPSDVAVWYAQYDTAHHAPVTGIYLLTLQGEANKVSDYSEPDNRYYNVDLYWRSSLNEMAGSAVEQTYIIYQVVTDSVTGVRRRVAIDTVKNCTDFRPHLQLDTLYQQHAHSYTLTYIIEGSPTDSDHPGFVAWSNEVKLIIPGYDDFMILKLHHYESDFEIRRVGDVDYNANNGTYDEKNYYRNYLQPENDIVNGITAEAILGGYDSFMLYRSYTVNGVQMKEAVAKLKFAVDEQGKVRYKITYVDEHENYNSPNFPNGTQLENIINQLLNNQ